MSIQSLFSLFTTFVAGPRLIDGGELLTLAKLTLGSQSGLVALAGGGGPGATPLAPGLNAIKTVVTTGDSCVLPQAVAGLEVDVTNLGANSTNIFPAQTNPNNASSAGDQIVPYNSVTPGTAASGSVALATQNTCFFLCYVNGIWKQTAPG